MGTWVFWGLVGFVAVPFVVYPVSIWLLAACMNRDYDAATVTPTVSVLIAAHNEAARIRSKVENTLHQTYPAHLLQVVVVDDGSDDATAAEVDAICDPRVVLVRMPERCGKAEALNRGTQECSGDVLVLTDADVEFAPDAVARLVRGFADPDVGGVCGNQFNKPGQGPLGRAEVLYWEYDKWLKRMESRTGSICGAYGSIYAIRRRHFVPIPPGACDDLFLSAAVIEDHKRLVFDETAVAAMEPPEGAAVQFTRRARITSRALRALWVRRHLLNPVRTGLYAWVVIGHKVLRRAASPVVFLLLPVSAWAALSGGRIYVAAFTLQIAIYLCALLGCLVGNRKRSPVLSVPYYFVVGIAATTVGIWRFMRGEQRTLWQPVRE